MLGITFSFSIGSVTAKQSDAVRCENENKWSKREGRDINNLNLNIKFKNESHPRVGLRARTILSFLSLCPSATFIPPNGLLGRISCLLLLLLILTSKTMVETEESIYNLIPKEAEVVVKPPLHQSKFKDSSRDLITHNTKKKPMATMGPLKVEKKTPTEFVKKHTNDFDKSKPGILIYLYLILFN